MFCQEDRYNQTRRSIVDNKKQLSELSRGGIELSVQGSNGGHHLEYSSIFVSWCISPALALQIKEQTLLRKKLLLLILHYPVRNGVRFEKNEERKLVELDDPIAYLSFGSPGTHHIVALIVWGRNCDELDDLYLSKRDGDWKNTAISRNGSSIILKEREFAIKEARGFEIAIPAIHWLGTGFIGIEIPGELFAKKPFDWKWTNWMFENNARNQCILNKRRLLAYTIQPFIFILWGCAVIIGASIHYFIRILKILALLILGFRGIHYASLWNFNPKKFPLKRVSENLTGSIFERLFYWLWWDRKFRADREERRWERNVKVRKQERQQLEAATDRLICKASTRKPDVSGLPLRLKTIKFHTLALKQKFCREFAK